MTVRIDERTAEALAPVRAALLAAARRETDQRVTRAREQATGIVAAAAREAEHIVTAAGAAGTADAEAVTTTDRSRARRAARARTLRAHRAAYEQLRRRSREAAVLVRAEPGYAALRAALDAEARRLLGPDAEIVEADGGGVVGRAGARSVDLSLAAFAERAVDTVAAGMDQP
ncbi:hypothetical protein [Actinoplanes sp. NPDC049599]|uniref:hypothetical protein n=1 Tax=Actinoplanes sp. NPDC049599 TaxID=3363903 RepID=UPI0037A2A1C2